MTNARQPYVYMPQGEIRTTNAYEFEQDLLSALEQHTVLTLDMEKVAYISSAGLRALLAAQQFVDNQDNAEFMLININEEVMDVLKTTGLVNVLTIK